MGGNIRTPEQPLPVLEHLRRIAPAAVAKLLDADGVGFVGHNLKHLVESRDASVRLDVERQRVRLRALFDRPHAGAR